MLDTQSVENESVRRECERQVRETIAEAHTVLARVGSRRIDPTVPLSLYEAIVWLDEQLADARSQGTAGEQTNHEG